MKGEKIKDMYELFSLASLAYAEYLQKKKTYKEFKKETSKLFADFMKEQQAELARDVTRVEVIDENGRSYVNWNKDNKVRLDFQDEGKTLKIFISTN